VGGLDVKGDLIELVDKGAGLETAFFRKTRAGGNWLTGGIVMMRWCVAVMLRLYGCSDVGMSQSTAIEELLKLVDVN
jgi:hypothetical protein